MSEAEAKAWRSYWSGNQAGSGSSSGGGGGDDSGLVIDEEVVEDYPIDQASIDALGIEGITPSILSSYIDQGYIEEYLEDGMYKYRWIKKPSGGGSSNHRGSDGRDKWQASNKD